MGVAVQGRQTHKVNTHSWGQYNAHKEHTTHTHSPHSRYTDFRQGKVLCVCVVEHSADSLNPIWCSTIDCSHFSVHKQLMIRIINNHDMSLCFRQNWCNYAVWLATHKYHHKFCGHNKYLDTKARIKNAWIVLH